MATQGRQTIATCLNDDVVTVNNITAPAGGETHPAGTPQYFGLLFDEINDGVFLYDFANARVRAANRRAQEMFGYSAEEVLGLTIAAVTAGTPPHTEADALARMQEILAADRTELFEWRARNKSGRLFWVEVIARRVCIEDEDLLLVMVRDIGKRIETQAELKESEERFLLLFQSSPLGLALVKPDFFFAEVNPAFSKLVGYTTEELAGKTFLDITHPDDRDLDLGYGSDLLAGRIPSYQLEKRYIHKEGHAVLIKLTGTVIRDRQGQIVYGLGIIEDLSWQRAMLSDLHQSEVRYRTLFESAPLGMLTLAPSLTLLDANDAFCRMLGYRLDELRGKHFLDITHADDHAADLECARDVLAGKLSSFTAEKRYLHKDGHPIWVSVTRSVVRDADGSIIYALGIVQDISERREADRLRIEHLEQQRDVLVREVHHRIKNNLQGVISLIEQLKRKQPEAAEALEEAAGQVGAIAVVHGLQGSTMASEVLPRQLVHAIVASVERIFDVVIDCREGDAAPDWEWRLNPRDSVSIALVLNELLYNAFKHNDPAGAIEVNFGGHSGAFGVRVFNRPATLPPGFDFSAARGLGTGLTLISSLLPRQGARLSIQQRADGVEAHLLLTHPCAMPQHHQETPP